MFGLAVDSREMKFRALPSLSKADDCALFSHFAMGPTCALVVWLRWAQISRFMASDS